MSVAARTARSASSSCTRGRPNTAMIASPMYFSITPPCRWRMSRISAKYRCITSRSDSGSMLSPRAVESFRSQKTTVTVLRTSGVGADGASGVPQKPHSLNRSGFSSPQSGQMRTAPHSLPQNRATRAPRTAPTTAGEAPPPPSRRGPPGVAFEPIAHDRRGGHMGAVGALLRIAGIRRLLAAWFGAVSAEYGALVAISVYAFTQGGARAVALFGVLRILPALLLTPLVTSMADRVARERLLLWATVVRAAALALVCVAVLADLPLLVVLVLAGLESAFLGIHRPAQNALLPWLARTPEELTAANVLSSLLEGTAVFVGPALVGVVLAVSGPGAAVAVMTVLMLGAVGALARLRVAGQQPPSAVSGGAVRRVAEDLLDGLRVYPATPGTSTLLGLVFVQTLVRGALTVLVVLLAVDVLGIGEPGVGWLSAAMGLGGLAGGVVAVRVVRGRWLARWAALGVAAWGLPLVALAAVDSVPLALTLFALVGAANGVLDVAMFTSLQRALPARAIGRALGVLETVVLVGVGLG